MKKLTLLVALALSVFTGLKAQIKLLGTAKIPLGIFVPLKYSGVKFVAMDTLDNIIIYNLNMTLFKKIHVPHQPISYPMSLDDIGYISETLFDNDSTSIDYLFNGYSVSLIYYIRIYNDKGDTLFRKDSSYIKSRYNAAVVSPSIISTDSGTIMNVVNFAPGVARTTSTYKLPGRLYCPPCDGKGIGPAGESVSNVWNGWGYKLNSMPNPSGNATHITYTLPHGVAEGELIVYNLNGTEVKRFTVTSQMPYIALSTAELPAGTYIYKLQTTRGISNGRQHIVIH